MLTFSSFYQIRCGQLSGPQGKTGQTMEKSSKVFLIQIVILALTHDTSIIEGINLMENNQVALHTTPGCMHIDPPPTNQRGVSRQLNCTIDAGCTVGETAPNSFGAGFNNAGGGVYATQFDESG